MRQLNGAESEVKALRSMTQRMILTQKEMVCTSPVAGVHWDILVVWKTHYINFHLFRRKLFLRGVGLLGIGV